MSKSIITKFILLIIILFLNINQQFAQDTSVITRYDLDSNIYKQLFMVNSNQVYEYYYDLNGNCHKSIFSDTIREGSYLEVLKIVSNSMCLPEGHYYNDFNKESFQFNFSIIVDKDGFISDFRLLNGLTSRDKQKNFIRIRPAFHQIESITKNGIPVMCELIGTVCLMNTYSIKREKKKY